MTNELQIQILNERINLLKGRNKNNANIVKKLERKVRTLSK